ncbi:MAG: RNA-binding cell elongation regulator Jag/EloR [Oscillospiraceae bacterium]
MKSIIKTADTLEKAIELAVEELQTTVENVDVEVLEKAKKGFLGMFSNPYKIKVTIKEKIKTVFNKEPELDHKGLKTDKNLEKGFNDREKVKVQKAIDYILKVSKEMNGNVENVVVKKTRKSLLLDIVDNGSGVVIGRHGETLDSLQHLVNVIVNDDEHYLKIMLDNNGYREKREEKLKELAHKHADFVRKTGKNKVFEPMNPYERRIIHAEIQEMDGVSSYSVGKETFRKIIISSKNSNLDTKKHDKNFKEKQITPEDKTQAIKAGVDSAVKFNVFDDDDSKICSKVSLNK